VAIRLGAIQIDLLANTVSFSDGLTKASAIALNSSKNIQRSLTLIGVSATAMAASVAASFTEITKHAQDYALEMSRFSEKTGTTTETFSKLAYSAKLAGVPIDMLKGAMERLTRTSFAASNGQREAIAAYNAIGISVKDLQGPLKDSGSLLLQVSKNLEHFKDSTNKTGLEQKILGRTGSELAPMLRVLGETFEQSSARATLFGVVIGGAAAENARKLQVSLTEVESVALGLSLKLLTNVSPALQDASAKIVNFVTSSKGMETVDKVAKDIATAIHVASDSFVFLANNAHIAMNVLEGIAAIKLASFLAPMIISASKAQMGVGGIALAAGDLVGKMAGLPKIATNLTKMATSGLETARIIGMIATSESYAAAGAAAWDLALAPITVSLGLITGALGLLSIGVIAIGKHMLDVDSAAEKMSGGTVTWGDHWTAACNQMIDRFRVLKLEVDKLTHSLDNDDAETQKFVNKYGLLGKSITQAVSDAAAARRMGELATGGTVKPPAHVEQQKNAPLTPNTQPVKIDELKKKLAELAASATVAKKSLADAGKGLDFERADEIAKQYTKTLIELESTAKRQRVTLTDAMKAQALASITTQVNDSAQASYRDTLIRGTEQINAQVSATDLLTAAIGKNAAARRSAQVEAEFKTKTTGMDPDWLRMNQDLINQQKTARASELSAGDRQKDSSALDALKQQVSVQEMLNSAIAKGADAREAANLAAEQMAIRQNFADRGDTDQTALNAELAANKKLNEEKRKQSDLDAAVGMSPSLVYQDQADRLKAIAKAANDAGISISKMQMDAASKANWDSYLESINKTTLAVGSASDGVAVFFRQMANQSESAAQQMHDVLGGAFESLNSTLERLISGQKASFSDFFRGIASQVGNIGLKKVESGIAGALTGNKGKSTDPMVAAQHETNRTLSQILAAVSNPLKGGSQTGLGSMITSAATPSGSNWFSSALGKIGSFASLIPGVGPFASLFGGHRALGGDVTAGMTYDVGEMGRERFTPMVNGKITPNNQMGGGGHTINIDARGSNDPAQVEAHVRRAMDSYAPHLIAASVHAGREQNMRRPSSARR